MLFQSYAVGIPAALFFAWMITNVYLFLLYTLSKNVLPHAPATKTRVFSIACRIVFICFIAIVVSKPIEVLLFSAPLAGDIETFKKEQLEKYAVLTNEYFDGEIGALKQTIEKQKKLSDGAARVEQYELLVQKRENQKRELLMRMENLVGRSNYYVRSIVILNEKYPICWFFTLLVVAVFLTPANLKNFLGEASNFYKCKKEIETHLIRYEYAQFKAEYKRLLKEKYDADKDFSEPFADAPFNTKLKTDDREFLSEADLIAQLYNA